LDLEPLQWTSSVNFITQLIQIRANQIRSEWSR
jgi:hypothetical protein